MLVLIAAAALVPTFTPLEASHEAKRLGRPLPSYVEVAAPNARMFASGVRLPVYLNRHGGTYQCGDDDSSRNISSVVCNQNGTGGSGNVGAFSGSDADWAQVMSCVTDEFSRFNLTITDQEPSGGEYVEAVVGGTPDQAGMPFGVGGVAPFSCGLIPTGVVYAFADVYQGDNQGICETVAQEVSHAFGLDHEFLCEDPMTYLTDCGPKTFHDQDASCGEYEPRQCTCGGTSQNSVQEILQVIGASDGTVPPPPPPDGGPPTASLTSPADQATLAANSTIDVVAQASDDTSLTVVELQWDFTGESMFCPATTAQTGSYSCTQSGSTYTWSISVGQGSRTFRVHVRDGAGNDTTTDSRTVWLSTDGSGPPTDGGPPSVIIGAPANGAQLAANSSINVVAQAGDDSGLAKVELIWQGGSGGDLTVPCPADGSNGVQCAVNGSTYTWTLGVGTGSRSFSVRATDVVGNETTSDVRSVTLVDNPTTPADDDHEGDNTADTATALHCGDTVDGVAANADWYSIPTPDGEKVTVTVDGDAKGNVSMVATRGANDVLANGTNDVSVKGDGTKVDVAVLPNSVDAGNYSISVECIADTGAAPKKGAVNAACGSAGGAAPLLSLLAGVAFLRRRRAA